MFSYGNDLFRAFGSTFHLAGMCYHIPTGRRHGEARRGRCGRGESMYIELFLLDNLLMDLLILRLASSMLSVKASAKRTVPAAVIGTVAAALGAGGVGFLLSLPAKLISTLLMALALPFRSLGGYIHAVLAVFVSAITVGGAAMLAAMLAGGGLYGGILYGGIPLSAAICAGAAAALLPRGITRMLLFRTRNTHTVRLIAEFHAGNGRFCRIECAALVDTGNALIDPLTALPVVVVSRRRYPAEASSASIPIPVRTAAGSGVIYALRPEKLLIDGLPVNALVAFSGADTALVPPSLLSPAGISRAG